MNNKIKFILPRLLGITIVVGAAVLILSIVFKLLLAGLVLTGIGMFVAKMMGKRHEKQIAYGKETMEFLPYSNTFQKQQKTAYSHMRKEDLAIIPIQ
ncbi:MULTISPECIES: hypothetical protein [unclassified Chryseobacterium]|uniref:hypothetical protein n=1 Tax=unclassified Chryseobacterium TaxID=2593645 RepID=UPI000F4AB672|nr:hypothetical protein [Chryseobacterium sp. BIGb0232]MCS4303656.1 hypothetical protein [Chryseobacterium sp. BIGb0232]ROS10354.1 hypothetical protein EDF65_4236 [Chryseobacterium nakagawai]